MREGLFRRHRLLLVWGAAFAFLGVAWVLRDVRRSGAVARQPQPLLAEAARPDPEAVRRIRLVRGGAAAIVLEREETGWWQTEPFRVALDDFSARQLAVETSGLAGLPVEDAELAALGLDPPSATVTIEEPDRTTTVEFGRRGVAGRAFVRAAGGAPYVVDAVAYSRAVEADPREWRSRALFPDALGRPASILWTLGDGSMELVRTGERWNFTKPTRTRADGERVDELLAGLVRARSDGFLMDQPAALGTFGLDPPAASVTLTADGPSGPATRTLRIGAPLGVGTADRYAMLDAAPTVMRLSAGTQATLFPRRESLIDPIASAARSGDVKRMEVRTKSAGFEVVRSLDRWTAAPLQDGTAGTAVPANPGVAEALLAALTEARAPEIAIAAFPQELEIATVLFFGFDERPLDVVRVARDPKTSKWALENGDGVLRIHPAGLALPLDAESFGIR
jgi:hypothetical protein